MMEDDAGRIVDADGDEVTYYPGGDVGAGVTINVIPRAAPIDTSPADQNRTLSKRTWIAVAKRDVAAPIKNKDTVAVPASWLGETGADVTLIVSSIEGDLTDPGFWIMGLD